MSNEIREQLSALMDGELPRDQVRFLLRRVDADAQLTQTWTRYQMASSVLRRSAVLPLREDFAEALMQSIAAGQAGMGKRLLRWAGGGAIAAAVAVFALVSTRPGANGPQPAVTTVVAAMPLSAGAEAPSRSLALPPVPAFNFAQPAAAVITLPSYRRDGSEQPMTLGPYVLLTAPASTQQAEPPLALPQH